MDNSIIVFSELTFILEFLLRVEHTLAQTDDEEVLLNLQFLKKELETFIDGFDFKGFFFPVKYAFNYWLKKYEETNIFHIYLEGIQVDFQKLASWTTFESLSDYQDLISRYNLFEAYAFQGLSVDVSIRIRINETSRFT